MIPFPKQPAFWAQTTAEYEALFQALRAKGYARPFGHAGRWDELVYFDLSAYHLSLDGDGTILFVPLTDDSRHLTRMNSARAFLDYVAKWQKEAHEC